MVLNNNNDNNNDNEYRAFIEALININPHELQAMLMHVREVLLEDELNDEDESDSEDENEEVGDGGEVYNDE